MSRRFSIIGSGPSAITDSGSVLTATETLTVPVGAVGAPSLNFAGDLTTGIFHSGASTIDLAIAGSNNFRFSSNVALIGGTNGMVSFNGKLFGVVASTSQKSETGADAAVLSYTPAAAISTYRVNIAWSVTTATTAVIGWTATWKDSGGVAQAPTNLSLFQVGTAAPALTFTAATGSAYYATAQFDVDNSATAIVIKTTMGTGTLTASKLTATIERIN